MSIDILGAVMDVSVRYNIHNSKSWGVVFEKEQNGSWSAYVGSPIFFIKAENVMAPMTQFYSFFDDAWKEKNAYPVPVSRIQDTINASEGNCRGMIEYPISNILNMLDDEDEYSNKCRVIFFSGGDPADADRGEILLKFDNEVALIEGLGKVTMAPSSTILQPLNGAYYVCRIVGQENGVFLADIIRAYGQMQMGIKYSEGLYIPQTVGNIPCAKSIGMPFDAIPEMRNKSWHVDYNLLKHLSQILLSTGGVGMQIHFPLIQDEEPGFMNETSKSKVNPIIMKSEGPNGKITICAASLNQNRGGDIR